MIKSFKLLENKQIYRYCKYTRFFTYLLFKVDPIDSRLIEGFRFKEIICCLLVSKNIIDVFLMLFLNLLKAFPMKLSGLTVKYLS